MIIRMDIQPKYFLTGYCSTQLVFADVNDSFHIFNQSNINNKNTRYRCQQARQKCSARVTKLEPGEYKIFGSHMPNCKVYSESQILVKVELEQLKNKVKFFFNLILYQIIIYLSL